MTSFTAVFQLLVLTTAVLGGGGGSLYAIIVTYTLIEY